MNPDLEKSIIEKYPSLFANVGQKGSPMCFGLEVGDGWAGIISTMCWILNQRDTDKKFRFDQVKEKFGLLRAYHSGGSEYMAGVVRMAEDMSGRTCEVCGQPGEQRKGGWIKTLCDRCHGGEGQVSLRENLTPGIVPVANNEEPSGGSTLRWVSVAADEKPGHGDTVWVYDGDDVFMGEYWGESSGFQSYGSSCDREGLNSETLIGITHWAEIIFPQPPVSAVGKHGESGK